MQNQLQKAINLAKKTGDRLIVFDESGESAYVVMSLEEYERLAVNRSEVRGLTEDELLDKINRDIAIWKNEQDFFDENFNDEEEVEDYCGDDCDCPECREEAEYRHEHERPTNFEDRFNFNKIEDRVRSRPRRWSIPRDRLEAADEVIEEDRHYLEEIPF